MQKDQKWLYSGIASVLGHALVLVVAITQGLHHPVVPPPALKVSLVEPPQIEAADDQEIEPMPLPRPEVIDAAMPNESPAPADQDIDPSAITQTEATTNRALKASILQQLPDVVSELNPQTTPDAQVGHQGRSVPKLPGGPSLFDAWLAPVEAGLDRWVDQSGGVNARVRLASGHIVCIEIRGPTTQELFNPWMSAAIPMSRLCGRQRPPEVDLTDPWLRARPKTQSQ